MFQTGDYVVNAINGICQITDIAELDLTGSKELKEYFVLVPLEEKSAMIYIPAEYAANRIRPAIGREEALRVIDSIPDTAEIEVRTEKERENKYKEALHSCNPTNLVGMMKTLNHRKRDRLAQGKKCTALDERYLKLTEKYLLSELAFALDCEKDEVKDRISARVESMIA